MLIFLDYFRHVYVDGKISVVFAPGLPSWSKTEGDVNAWYVTRAQLSVWGCEQEQSADDVGKRTANCLDFYSSKLALASSPVLF
jgi:hypothetical protein